MKKLIHEVHRRSIWQVLGIYLAVSWIVLQVVDVVGNNFGLPDWVAPAALILLLIGLPIVVATAFVQEGMGTREAEPVEPSPADVGEEPPPLASPSAAEGLFTWRRALLGGVAAFTLLGVGAAVWLGMRALGVGPAATLVAQGVLEEREPIVLADFSSPPDEPDLGDALTEALRIELGNSTILDVVDGAEIVDALRRMQRDPAVGLDREAALELAIREGYKAVIAGDVRNVAGAYQLSAQVLRASDGESLAGFRETAKNSDDLIDAIDKISKDLRQKAGESIRTVRSSEPLDEVSTASLDALQLYSEGVRAFDAGDMDRAAALLEDAVAIDSGFAMAHRKRGAVYQNRRQIQSLVDAASAAFRHRDRLTRSERLHVEGIYRFYVEGDFAAASRAYEELVELDPEDGGALNNLAIALNDSDPEREVDLYRRALETGLVATIGYTNLAIPLVELGRYDEALAVLEEGEQRFPDAASIPLRRIGVYAGARRYDEARSTIAGVVEGFRGTYEADVLAPWWGAMVAGLHGKISETEARVAAALPRAIDGGSVQDIINLQLTPLFGRLYALDDPAGAIRGAESILERFPLDSVPAFDRQTLSFAVLFASAGEPARARALVARWDGERVAGNPNPFQRARALGLVALAEGNLEEAIAALQRLDVPAGDACRSCLAFDLGRAYERAGDRDAAIEAYERHVASTEFLRLFSGYATIPVALQRLGDLYEARAASATGSASEADRARAAEHYRHLVTLWGDADPALQPRLRAVQARLSGLEERTG